MDHNFLDESLSESNFDLTPSLQDRLDNYKDFDLISDSSSLCASNSFSLRRMDSGLDPKPRSPRHRNPFENPNRSSFDIFPDPLQLNQVPSPAMQASFFKKSSPVDDKQKFELYKSLPDEGQVRKSLGKRKSRGSLISLGSKNIIKGSSSRKFDRKEVISKHGGNVFNTEKGVTSPSYIASGKNKIQQEMRQQQQLQPQTIQTHNNININNFHFGPDMGSFQMPNLLGGQGELMDPAQYQQIYNELTLGQGGNVAEPGNKDKINHHNPLKARKSAFAKYKGATGLEEIEEEESENMSLGNSSISQEQISFAVNSSKKLQNFEILSQFTGNDYSIKSNDPNNVKNSLKKIRSRTPPFSASPNTKDHFPKVFSLDSDNKSPYSPSLDILSPENPQIGKFALKNASPEKKKESENIFKRKVPEFQTSHSDENQKSGKNSQKNIKKRTLNPKSFEIQNLEMGGVILNFRKTSEEEKLKKLDKNPDSELNSSIPKDIPTTKKISKTQITKTPKSAQSPTLIPLKQPKRIQKIRLKNPTHQDSIQESPKRRTRKSRSKSPTINVYQKILQKATPPSQKLDIQKEVAKNLAKQKGIAMSMSIDRDQFRNFLKHARSEKNVEFAKNSGNHNQKNQNFENNIEIRDQLPVSKHFRKKKNIASPRNSVKNNKDEVVIIKKRKMRAKGKTSRRQSEKNQKSSSSGNEVIIRVKTKPQKKSPRLKKISNHAQISEKLMNWSILEKSLGIIQNTENWDSQFLLFQNKFKPEFSEISHSLKKKPKLLLQMAKSYFEFSQKNPREFEIPKIDNFAQMKIKYGTQVEEGETFPKKIQQSSGIFQKIMQNDYKKQIFEEKNFSNVKFLFRGLELKYFCLSEIKKSKFSEIIESRERITTNFKNNFRIQKKNNFTEEKIIQIKKEIKDSQSENKKFNKKEIPENSQNSENPKISHDQKNSELDAFLFGNFGPCAFPLKIKSLKKLSSLRGINLKSRIKNIKGQRARSQTEKKQFLSLPQKQLFIKKSKNSTKPQASSFPKDKLKFVRKSRPKTPRKSRSSSRKRSHSLKKSNQIKRKRSSSISKPQNTKNQNLNLKPPQMQMRTRKKSVSRVKTKIPRKSKKLDKISKPYKKKSSKRTKPAKFANQKNLKNVESEKLKSESRNLRNRDKKKGKREYQSGTARAKSKFGGKKARGLTPNLVRKKKVAKRVKYKRMGSQRNEKTGTISVHDDRIYQKFSKTETDLSLYCTYLSITQDHLKSETQLTLNSNQSNQLTKTPDFLSQQKQLNPNKPKLLQHQIESDMLEGLLQAKQEFQLISPEHNSTPQMSPICSLGNIEVEFSQTFNTQNPMKPQISQTPNPKSNFHSEKELSHQKLGKLLKNHKVANLASLPKKKKHKKEKRKKKKIQVALAKRGDISPNPKSTITKRSLANKKPKKFKKKTQPKKTTNPKSYLNTKIQHSRQSERITPNSEKSDSYFQKYRLKKMNSQGGLKVAKEKKINSNDREGGIRNFEQDPYGLVRTSLDLKINKVKSKFKKQKSSRTEFNETKQNVEKNILDNPTDITEVKNLGNQKTMKQTI